MSRPDVDLDALLLGRRTYVTHAEAFEPMAPGDPFGDMMNTPAKNSREPAVMPAGLGTFTVMGSVTAGSARHLPECGGESCVP